MPRARQSLLFIGIKNTVVALDDANGEEVWRTPLRGSDFVSVHWDGEALFASNSGEVWRLDPRTGVVAWHNKLKGLGLGLVTMASSRAAAASSAVEATAAMRRQQQAAAAAAAAG
jgi:outer membrane protein assembly factor BamB